MLKAGLWDVSAELTYIMGEAFLGLSQAWIQGGIGASTGWSRTFHHLESQGSLCCFCSGLQGCAVSSAYAASTVTLADESSLAL